MLFPSGTRARFSAAALLCVAVCGIVSASSLQARADQARVRLRYERVKGTEACVDESALRDAVSARLGYDPFVASEPADIVEVQVSPRGQGFEGRIVRRAATEAVPSKPSRIRSRGSDCGELAEALALAVSVAIDPLSLTRAEAPEVQPPVEHDAEQAPSDPAEAPRIETDDDDEEGPPDLDARARLAAADAGRDVTQLHMGLGPTLGGWVLPRVSFGGQVLLGVSHAWFELDVDARYEASSAHDMPAGVLESALFAASLAPCVRYGWVLACVAGTVGSMRGTLRTIPRADQKGLYAAFGLRSALEIPLWNVLSLRLHGAWLYRAVDTERFGWQPHPSGFVGGALFMVRTP